MGHVMMDKRGVILLDGDSRVVKRGEQICLDVADLRDAPVHAVHDVLDMLPRQLQETALDDLHRQFILAYADRIAGRAADLQHKLHIAVDLLRVHGAVMQEDVIVNVFTDDFSVRIYLLNPIPELRASSNRRRGGRWGDR